MAIDTYAPVRRAQVSQERLADCLLSVSVGTRSDRPVLADFYRSRQAETGQNRTLNGVY
jgi:hypothetical protein